VPHRVARGESCFFPLDFAVGESLHTTPHSVLPLPVLPFPFVSFFHAFHHFFAFLFLLTDFLRYPQKYFEDYGHGLLLTVNEVAGLIKKGPLSWVAN
jgi:hypothetical protein